MNYTQNENQSGGENLKPRLDPGHDSQMSFKERLERNIIAWTFAMLLAGFLAGIGVYEAGLRITNQTYVTKDSFYSKEDVHSNWIKKSDCKPANGGGSGDPIVQSPAASEIEHRANETLKFLQRVQDDLTRERYDARWILTTTVSLLNSDNSEVAGSNLNLRPEFEKKTFQNLIDALRTSANSGRPNTDLIQRSFNKLKDELLPAASHEYNKNNESAREAIADARQQLNSIKDGLGH